MAYPTLSPAMAATLRSTVRSHTSRPPAAATSPAVISSESPGRKNPTSSPVSMNTMAVSPTYPPHRTSSYRAAGSVRRASSSCTLAALLASSGGGDRRPPGGLALDPHRVEGAPDEHDGHEEEERGQQPARRRPAAGGQRHGQLHREQPEERGELDHRVHRHRGRVLERVAHGVADHGGGVERRPLLAELHLDDLLGVVPGAA